MTNPKKRYSIDEVAEELRKLGKEYRVSIVRSNRGSDQIVVTKVSEADAQAEQIPTDDKRWLM